MIVALGARFAANPAVVIVSASFANATSEDWNVPHAPTDILAWLAAGYTTDKMIEAGQEIIDTTMTAFPHQFVTLAIGGDGHSNSGPNLDPTSTYLAATTTAMSRTKWPGRLIVQNNSLSTFIPVAPGRTTPIGICSGSARRTWPHRCSITFLVMTRFGLITACLATLPRF